MIFFGILATFLLTYLFMVRDLHIIEATRSRDPCPDLPLIHTHTCTLYAFILSEALYIQSGQPRIFLTSGLPWEAVMGLYPQGKQRGLMHPVLLHQGNPELPECSVTKQVKFLLPTPKPPWQAYGGLSPYSCILSSSWTLMRSKKIGASPHFLI